MAQTPSTMSMKIGEIAPNFTLLDTISGKPISLQDIKSNYATVIMFICNHCPFVKHIQKEIVKLSNDYIPKGISFVAISSNDVDNYPEDSPEKMKQIAKEMNYPFPYLYDETQGVAKEYKAACTPDFYIFDKELKCIYRGQLDDSRPSNGIPVTGRDIRNALDLVLQGKMVTQEQKPSIGCNIKWKNV
ncbi:MAG: thioredoxin family protein [Leptospiraceae bacterium]|nr:thioredoxin family protein [Leptospiraceae bacterium]MCP5494611.1 thioredoxin family protein [Leptospiraceae bacterium]